MSVLQAEEMDQNQKRDFSILSQSINKQRTKSQIELEEPVDKFSQQIEGSLKSYKTSLSNKINVENMVSFITQKILQKYAGQETNKEVINNAMDDFMAHHKNYDIRG